MSRGARRAGSRPLVWEDGVLGGGRSNRLLWRGRSTAATTCTLMCPRSHSRFRGDMTSSEAHCYALRHPTLEPFGASELGRSAPPGDVGGSLWSGATGAEGVSWWGYWMEYIGRRRYLHFKRSLPPRVLSEWSPVNRRGRDDMRGGQCSCRLVQERSTFASGGLPR